jgi:hypothetical protein
MIEGSKFRNEVPEGKNFLDIIFSFAQHCEARSDQSLKSPMCEQFGTLLSLLDRAGSCWWGCHGGDHALEHLVGRCCSYSVGAFKLARSGFYDESLSLIRTVGEMANLYYLFCVDPNALGEWKNSDDKKRKNKFSPVKVRLALEKNIQPVPIDQRRYRQLSEKAVHIHPNIPPQMYNAHRLSKAGGAYQEAGLFLCLSEIGFSFSMVGICTFILFNLPDDASDQIYQAASSLNDSVPELRARVNVTFPGTYGKK